MIRCSAGLVVVALGVLIGGVVTSNLSLVYVSIAISVLALIAWAIGVFLKRRELREELFGGRSELVPATAGVGAGLPASGRPASASAPLASPVAAFSPLAQVRPAWAPEAAGTRDAGASPGHDHATAPVGGWGSTNTPPFGTPAVAPRAWDGAKAGSNEAERSWFDRLPLPLPVPVSADKGPAKHAKDKDKDKVPLGNTSSDIDVPVPLPVPADVAATPASEDEWPRYSWLDDEENEEAGEAVESTDVPLESDDAVAAEVEASDLPKPAPKADAATEDAADDGTAKMVTVVPGVLRYHEPDCVLIRFMPSADVQTTSVPEAKAAKCTPCVACQPEG